MTLLWQRENRREASFRDKYLVHVPLVKLTVPHLVWHLSLTSDESVEAVIGVPGVKKGINR